jgi:tetratricopeptide (TPR) repeat protein
MHFHKQPVTSLSPSDARRVVMPVQQANGTNPGEPLDAHEFDESPLVPKNGITTPRASGDARVAMVSDASVALPSDAPTRRAADARVATASDARVNLDAAAALDVTAVQPDRKKQAAQLLEQAQQALEDGDPERALTLSDQSLKLRRTQRTLLERARALQRLGRIDDALKSIDDALEIGQVAPAWEQRAVILWSVKRYDEARVAMQKYLELEPQGKSAESFKQMLQLQP